MQAKRRSGGDGDAALNGALQAVELAFTDPGRAAALADGVHRRADAGPQARAVARRASGLVAVARGELETAARHLRDAIALADDSLLPARAGEARASLSYVLLLTGHTAAALAEVERAGQALQGVPAGQALMQRALILTELGRLDEAETGFDDAVRALRRAGGSPLIEGDVYTNRSQLHSRRADWRAADDDLARAADLYARAGHAGRLALVEHNRGSVAVVRGDFPAAFAHFDEAESRYRAQDRDPGLLPVERAEAMLSVRLVAEARAAAQVGVTAYERQGNAVDLVEARLVLALAALADNDPDAARLQAERARRSAARQGRPGWAALAGYVAVRARWDGGDRGAAMLAGARRALRALDGSGWVIAAADARLIVARLLLDLGRTPQARRLLVEGAAARRRGPAELRARAWYAEALLRQAGGDRRGAIAALGSGMDVLDRLRASLGATELRATVTGAGADLAHAGIALALESGRAPEVLRWAERWRAGALLLPPARPPDDHVLAADLAELRDVAKQAGVVGGAGGDMRPVLARQAAIERAVLVRSRHVRGADVAKAATPSPAALPAAVRAALGPAELVEFLVHDGDLWAVVLRGGRAEVCALGPVDAVTPEMEAMRFGLRRLAYGIGSPSSLDAAEAMVDRAVRTLDGLLLAPLGIAAGADRTPLVVVPTGPLHAMPWAALPSCSGRPVSLAPSAALWLRASASARPAPGGRRVLVAGPGLEHAAAEVAALARRDRHAQLLTGRRARVEAVTAALDGAALAHIAAHGRFRADNPLFTSLELADGPLTVFDLERLVRPPLDVVLSACDSGLPAVHPGDELIGLAAALLAMGTRSLVASVIPVPDDATVALMVSLHRRLRGGAGPAAALAAAQLEAAGPGSTRRDRVAAAGFVCLGAG